MEMSHCIFSAYGLEDPVLLRKYHIKIMHEKIWKMPYIFVI